MIDDERKSTITRAAVLIFSLAVHGVVLYFAFTVPFNIRIINFRPRRADVVLVPAPRIKFTGLPGEPGAVPGVRAGKPGTGPAMPGRALTEEERRRAAEQEARGGGGGGAGQGAVSPPGGGPGASAGGGGIVRRDREGTYSSGFSLVYPADAMIHLDKYAQVPEDDWLRPYRPRSKPTANLSPYARSSGTAGPGAPGKPGGSGGIGGGIGTSKLPPAGVVAAYLPDNVKLFDLSGWANDVLNAVQKNWSLGADAGAADWSGQVTVTLLVMKTGEINGVDVNVSSNIEPLDQSVLRAIERSGPWPGLPEGFPDTSLEIQLVFRYGR